MTSVSDRILRAITDELERRGPTLDGCAGGTVSVTVKLDASGCPRRVLIATETEHVVERGWVKRPDIVPGPAGPLTARTRVT